MESGPPAVLIVDGHPVIRFGIRTRLEMVGGFRVAEAATCDEAIAIARELHPRIVIQEVHLPGTGSGFELARTIRIELPETRVLVFSSYACESYVRFMVDAGVDGFLLKETPAEDIVDSIQAVLSGRNVFSARLGSMLVEGRRNNGARLTRKQLDVLQRLADGHLNDEIATALGVSVKAVQIHLSAIYSRLGARTRTEAVVMAAKQGLVAIAGPAAA